MFANAHVHEELSRLRAAELAAQARHAELLRRARVGALQPELRAGREHDRRVRVAARRRGRPAMA
jgi:hypothetical protein